MWYLTSERDSRVIYVVPQNNSITIGRSIDGQTCNFAISDDASISRKHATLSHSDGLILLDLGSRYGTFVNDLSTLIDPNVPVKLQDRDVVRFGKLESVWKVNESKFVTCTSTLKGENLQNLKTCLANLGGTLKNEWDDTCMYLTMPAITLTIKVVLALVQGSQIVTTDYWNKCLEAINNNTVLPDPNKFIPQIVESTLNKEIVSFIPNTQRRTLFEGKKIVFFSRKQFDMYKTVLQKSAGSPLLLSETKMSKSQLCGQDVIVIQYNILNLETQITRNQIKDIVDHMKTMGKRVVADAEIGLAILYCSTEKYCNPNFNFSSEVVKQTTSGVQKPANVLAQESQDVKYDLQNKKENIIINESLISEEAQMNGSKRKLSDDNIQENANKKLAKDIMPSGNNRSMKRKNSGDTNIEESNPIKRHATADSENNDDEIFNFITPNNNNSNNQNKGLEKKLNLTKPIKRKHDVSFGADDDDLFQFVQDKSKNSTEGTKQSIFTIKNSHSNLDDETQEDVQPVIKKNIGNDNIDISALRGSKLEELMKSNIDNNANDKIDMHKIKKEKDDLDSKMNDLNLGTTIVTVKKELIVKKEPVIVESHNSTGKNFKKFKKVWPLKMQVTLMSNNITNQTTFNQSEMCSQSYDTIQE